MDPGLSKRALIPLRVYLSFAFHLRELSPESSQQAVRHSGRLSWASSGVRVGACFNSRTGIIIKPLFFRILPLQLWLYTTLTLLHRRDE